MKVILARNAGFCMGVRRAVETTIDLVRREEHGIATFGPLIHNPQVLGLLAERGVTVLSGIPGQACGTVIIRAHGVPPKQKAALVALGVKVQDATCPRVVKVQAIIRKYQRQGYATVIIGDRDHAEVVGLMGYAEPHVQVVSSDADLPGLHLGMPYIIVSQTTQDNATFQRLSAAILARFPGGQVFATICDSTRKRQEEVKKLCQKVEALVVVGGRTSANTQRLGEIAAKMGRAVFLVETEADLDWQGLAAFDKVGVTAGASTPTWMINRVVRAIECFPGKGRAGVRARLFQVMWYLLASNLYVALGGGLLALVSALLLGLAPDPRYFFMAFGYLFAMHNFNRFTNQEAGRFNDPARLAFFKARQWPLLAGSGLALAGALWLAFAFGVGPFLLLAGMSLLGVLYSVRLIPLAIARLTRVRRLKEISGSKTFFIALAWAFVTVLLPAWEGRRAGLPVAGLFAVVLVIVFIRNALFDVFDVQGDRIVGKETLPVCIGERKTMRVLYLLIGLAGGLLIALPMAGVLPRWAMAGLPVIAYLFVLIQLYAHGKVCHGVKLEFGLETVFPLCSLAMLAGRLLLA
ncbi:MAG: 4-hydroxy-3-methylbut-2-enyl diphosphate reductase [Deltaproteobacteria bacterium CG23_combo_of_CG06-09_8_20_14_all_60_8]|nr:MAG: 4-hydroxy-3-methylbut-2-enyl diphosphate reductase [Desulfobacterales bacterium CG2_30_60_27]PIP44171.1 MAG: 4-hydroxy-3-methylbut-2-enyl diphosphate reductase [Deltaproteobacteria bacterium CG23_combo_of_CG06-09_8_20_14_all_60_8]